MIKINEIAAAGNAEWDEILRSCPYATFFHSRQWAEIWQRYSKGKMHPAPLIIRFSDGKSAILPLTLTKVAMGALRLYLSSPGGTYGGWISSAELMPAHEELLSNIMLDRGRIIWRMNPFRPATCVGPLKAKMQADDTHALNLTEGMEHIFKRWSKGHRSAVTKAEREGVTVSQAEKLDDWMVYFGVYEDSIRRWGKKATSTYRSELFQDLFHQKTNDIKLWLAYYGEVCVAGALCFYTNNHVAYWHGATLSDAFKLRPANFLLHEVIKDASERGYTWFDFNPSGGHEGVRAFKKSFAAESLPCPVITHGAGYILTLNNWMKKVRATFHQ